MRNQQRVYIDQKNLVKIISFLLNNLGPISSSLISSDAGFKSVILLILCGHYTWQSILFQFYIFMNFIMLFHVNLTLSSGSLLFAFPVLIFTIPSRSSWFTLEIHFSFCDLESLRVRQESWAEANQWNHLQPQQLIPGRAPDPRSQWRYKRMCWVRGACTVPMETEPERCSWSFCSHPSTEKELSEDRTHREEDGSLLKIRTTRNLFVKSLFGTLYAAASKACIFLEVSLCRASSFTFC